MFNIMSIRKEYVTYQFISVSNMNIFSLNLVIY